LRALFSGTTLHIKRRNAVLHASYANPKREAKRLYCVHYKSECLLRGGDDAGRKDAGGEPNDAYAALDVFLERVGEGKSASVRSDDRAFDVGEVAKGLDYEQCRTGNDGIVEMAIKGSVE
jgi:hypothetical protein